MLLVSRSNVELQILMSCSYNYSVHVNTLKEIVAMWHLLLLMKLMSSVRKLVISMTEVKLVHAINDTLCMRTI
jgi:hypothetical protein